MSTFETKQLDNFVFDELVDPREQQSVKTPFLRKNIVYQVDSQNGAGAYTSPDVIIDTQSIASSGNLLNWRDAYIAVPFRTKYEIKLSTSGVSVTGENSKQKILGIKNMAFLHNVKVEANGKVIVSANEGLEHLVNVKALSTWNAEMVEKDGATVMFAPDSQGVLGFTDDNINLGNDTTYSTNNSCGANPLNTGLVKRQDFLLPSIQSLYDSSGNTNGTLSPDNIIAEGICYDSCSTASATAFDATSTSYQLVSDLHYVGIIRLRDICDLFDKHPLARGVSYRFTLRFNQAVSTWTQASSTHLLTATTVVTTNTTGSVQPAVAVLGANTQSYDFTLNTAGTTAHRITHKIDTDADNDNSKGQRAIFSGVRIYVESFEPAPEALEEILSKEPVERWFNDYLYNTTPTAVAPNGNFNLQVSTSCTNPRAVILIPRIASGTAVDTTETGVLSVNNPFCMAPGCTDAFLSLTNVQVKVGSSYVLPDRVFYTYQAFLDNTRSVFSVDGSNSNMLTGLISKKGFETNMRFYVFDLSRYPEAMTDLPQMVAVEGKNNTKKNIELEVITIYGRRAEWNNAQGSMTITA